MPLTRSNITSASRTMLPAYIVVCALFGGYYLLDPGGRLERAPSVTFQRQVMPLEVWGAILLTIAVLMVAALASRRRYLFAYALCCCALTWLIWGGAIAVSIFQTDNTSYLAPVLPWFVTVCCIASTKSLVTKEHS